MGFNLGFKGLSIEWFWGPGLLCDIRMECLKLATAHLKTVRYCGCWDRQPLEHESEMCSRLSHRWYVMTSEHAVAPECLCRLGIEAVWVRRMKSHWCPRKQLVIVLIEERETQFHTTNSRRKKQNRRHPNFAVEWLVVLRCVREAVPGLKLGPETGNLDWVFQSTSRQIP